MIKGAKKQMIVLRTGGSRYFDEAYFVLRRELPEHPADADAMLCEANRILEESAVCGRRRHTVLLRAFLFGAGLLCGAGAAVLIFLLI